MLKEHTKADKNHHLRSGLVFFVAWIGVVIAEVREFQGSGLRENLSRIKDGDLFLLFLVSASVILLALSIRSFVFYLQSKQ